MQLATPTPELSLLMVGATPCLYSLLAASVMCLSSVGVTLGSTGSFIVGSSAVLTCFNDAGVADQMEWLSEEGRLLVRNTSVQHLDISFDPVDDSLHDTMFTCSVIENVGGANRTVLNQTFPISVRGEFDKIMCRCRVLICN